MGWAFYAAYRLNVANFHRSNEYDQVCLSCQRYAELDVGVECSMLS